MNTFNKPFSTLAAVLFLSLCMSHCKEDVPIPEKDSPIQTLEFKSMDGLLITADLYQNEDRQAPIILLFHQARFSRGEYGRIAPRLVALGFTCIAVDQRSGEEINGVVNATHQRAVAEGLATEYINAMPDLLAAVGFVKAEYHPEKLIIWGSSYSASLAMIIANSHSADIAGLVSFSPGAYFEVNGKSIAQFAATLQCPVFMTASREEAPSRMDIFDAIPHRQKTFFIPELEGFHGSKALWPEHKGNEAYWTALETFLMQFVTQ